MLRRRSHRVGRLDKTVNTQSTAYGGNDYQAPTTKNDSGYRGQVLCFLAVFVPRLVVVMLTLGMIRRGWWFGNLNRGNHQSLVPMGLGCHWPSRPPAASNHQPSSNQPVSCHQFDSTSTDSDKTWRKSTSRLYPCLDRAFMMLDANNLAGQGDPRHPTHC